MNDFQKTLEKHRGYYHSVFVGIKEDISALLKHKGFTLKNADIGNVHGEVYADAGPSLSESISLHQIRIAPTQTGKLEMKLTFNELSKANISKGFIVDSQLFAQVGKPEKTRNGRYGIICRFVFDGDISKNPEEVRPEILERIDVLLSEICSSRPEHDLVS